MRNWTRLLIPGVVVTALLAGPAWAQTVPVSSLADAVSTLPDPFTLVNGVREVSDGRLVVVDAPGGSHRAVECGLVANRDTRARGTGAIRVPAA
jgi:hypothetical protein